MGLTKHKLTRTVSGRLWPRGPKQKAVDVVETLLELIKQSLESGDDVLISGFGKFKVSEKGERKGRNPATGEVKQLPARRVLNLPIAKPGGSNGKINHLFAALAFAGYNIRDLDEDRSVFNGRTALSPGYPEARGQKPTVCCFSDP